MKKLEDLKNIIDINLDKIDISTETKNKIIQSAAIEKKKRKARIFKILSIPTVAAAVIFFMMFSNIFGSNTGLIVSAKDLMKGITPAKVEVVEIKDDFIKSQADFDIELFKNSIKRGENSLVSPLSVYLALSMTANGGKENTLREFESVLGKYNIDIEDINRYNYSYMKKLNDGRSGKLHIANSIWYALDKVNVNRSFLQTNADYYNAAVFTDDFSSPQTVKNINNWVKSNTDNLIDKIIDKIDPETVMYLINAIYFEADWQEQYPSRQIKRDDFELINGKKVSTEFMYSTESAYIKDDTAQGFIKPYKDNKYSFVALLPNEGVSIDSYVSSLTGEKFLSLIKNKTNEAVITGIPKFKSEYNLSLVKPLKVMGLRDCFNSVAADFSKMNSDKDIFINDVKHKTFIQVDAMGTKAGALTIVEMNKGCAFPENRIILNCPFIYAIVDNKTGLPLFMGTMNNPNN